MGNEFAVVRIHPADAHDPSTARAILSRDDLSFTKRNPMGHLENWPNEHQQLWDDGNHAGKERFADVVTLAAVNEYEAYNAFRFALLSRNWSSLGYGEEDGFASELAKLAIAGLRALQGGFPPFDAKAAEDAADRAERASERRKAKLRRLGRVS
jgi:hypothetical protein